MDEVRPRCRHSSPAANHWGRRSARSFWVCDARRGASVALPCFLMHDTRARALDQLLQIGDMIEAGANLRTTRSMLQ